VVLAYTIFFLSLISLFFPSRTNWQGCGNFGRELHLGTRLTKGTLLSTKLHHLFFTSQYISNVTFSVLERSSNSPSQQEKESSEKEEHPKEEDTPIKKKLKKAYPPTPTTVVSSIRRLVYED